MRARRATGFICAVAIATGIAVVAGIGVAVSPADAAVVSSKGCVAKAGPDTGPIMNANTVYGIGSGKCAGNANDNEGSWDRTVVIVQRKHGTNPWKDGEVVRVTTQDGFALASTPCRPGTWKYRVITKTFARARIFNNNYQWTWKQYLAVEALKPVQTITC